MNALRVMFGTILKCQIKATKYTSGIQELYQTFGI